MEIFDTHFHLSAEDTFEDFLSRCRNDLQLASKDFAVPVDRLLMLCAGSNCAESVRAMEFAGYAENVYFSCGIHPHAATEYLAGEKPDFSIFRNEAVTGIDQIRGGFRIAGGSEGIDAR